MRGPVLMRLRALRLGGGVFPLALSLSLTVGMRMSAAGRPPLVSRAEKLALARVSNQAQGAVGQERPKEASFRHTAPFQRFSCGEAAFLPADPFQ
jgi:hypothetical protein